MGKQLSSWLVVVVVAMAQSSASVYADDYDLQIDTYKPSVGENLRGPKAADFTKGEFWGSVGVTDAQGNLTGLNFPNQSGKTIRGIWFKVKYPGVDTFSRTSSGGGAFPEAWRKKDGSELILRGGSIADGDDFWMQMPASTDETEPNGTKDRNRFFAQMYDLQGKPDIPNQNDWVRVRPAAFVSMTVANDDADLAVHDPHRLAWQFFARINQASNNGTNDVIWETWATDAETFPPNPDAFSPPEWPGTRSRGKVLRVPVKLTKFTPLPGQAAAPTIGPEGATEEVRRNKSTFDFIVANRLWYLEGIADAFRSGFTVEFPTTSIEVKADWTPISEFEKPRYHWNVDDNGKLFGLTALHISSKVLPNWFWATFEHVDNVDRGKVLGCQDTFGIVPANDLRGRVSDELKAMFRASNLGDEWLFYRLDGTQTDFLDSMGRPLRLGNSIIEGGQVSRSSCVNCHAMARADATQVGGFQFIVGTPDPKLFYNPDGSRKSLQLDFVWGFSFAQPVQRIGSGPTRAPERKRP